MTTPGELNDLAVVVADKQLQSTIETLLTQRNQALRIADITVDVQRHPHQDPGCRAAAELLLEPLRDRYRKKMVIFDYHGCGENDLTAEALERNLEQRFESRGWEPNTVAFVVIEPELEVWAFGRSFQRLGQFIGWSQQTALRDWLVLHGHLDAGEAKPHDPKAALDAMLGAQKKPRDSKLFTDLAGRVSLANCRDRAFRKFRDTLRGWFPLQ